MERCPVCRARLKDDPFCHRCRSDLSMLLKIEQEADSAVSRAIVCFARGDTRGMNRAAQHALALKATPLSKILLFLSETEPENGVDTSASESGPVSGRI